MSKDNVDDVSGTGSAQPKRFRVEINDITSGTMETVHMATVICEDHAELATYLRKVASLVDRHGD